MVNYVIYSVFAIIILFILYKYLKLSYSNYKTKKLSQKRLKRGYIKEKEAAEFLKQNGYIIKEHAKTYSYNLKVNGKSKQVSIEIDYLVKQNGKTYIVEVKSGYSAPNISNSSTRRQILEYYMFIPNDGILLLDMEKERISEIVFTLRTKYVFSFKLIAILVSIIVALGLYIYFKC